MCHGKERRKNWSKLNKFDGRFEERGWASSLNGERGMGRGKSRASVMLIKKTSGARPRGCGGKGSIFLSLEGTKRE